MLIKDLPNHQKPREKLMEKGAQGLSNKELLAILLRTGREGKNVLEVAEDILGKYPMKKLAGLGYEEIIKIKGIDSGKACSLLASFELTKRALEVEDSNLPRINSARDALAHLQEIKKAKREHFVALYLDARNQLLHKETISIGTLNTNLVHPREVFKPALENLAAGVIVAHNHPSGDPEPSEEDREITDRLKKAGEILGVNLVDSLVITEDRFRSVLKYN